MRESVDSELNRTLELLRMKMKETGWCQKDVEAKLSWGRWYIGGMLRGRKEAQLEQVLLILGVIGVEPRDFYFELYGAMPEVSAKNACVNERDVTGKSDLVKEVQVMIGVLRVAVRGLVRNNLITVEELTERIEEDGTKDGTEVNEWLRKLRLD